MPPQVVRTDAGTPVNSQAPVSTEQSKTAEVDKNAAQKQEPPKQDAQTAAKNAAAATAMKDAKNGNKIASEVVVDSTERLKGAKQAKEAFPETLEITGGPDSDVMLDKTRPGKFNQHDPDLCPKPGWDNVPKVPADRLNPKGPKLREGIAETLDDYRRAQAGDPAAQARTNNGKWFCPASKILRLYSVTEIANKSKGFGLPFIPFLKCPYFSEVQKNDNH